MDVLYPAHPAAPRWASRRLQPTGDRNLLPATALPADGVRRDRLACTYCRHPLTADSFEYLSGMRRLVSTNCPVCERRTTLRASTWIRLNESGQPEYPGTRTRP
ncbi:MAG TPA: hypothetical protein VHV82_18890 [Sporichthyaceae bacterium]|jgi:hypothetical protein|nr:hypothetical protein [Sporichthyaceae bacterium]